MTNSERQRLVDATIATLVRKTLRDFHVAAIKDGGTESVAFIRTLIDVAEGRLKAVRIADYAKARKN